MRRRKFIALAGGAAAEWPLAARAQQPTMPVIGFLNATSQQAYSARIAAFRQGLADAGFVEGRNVAIEFRHVDGRYDRLPAMAADLVRRQVAVIAVTGTSAALAAKAATTTIPIIFSTSANPVESGLVASLARPGGNVTGTTRLNVQIAAKRLQLLHELVPTATTIAVLINPANPALAEPLLRQAEAMAPTLGLKLHVLRASNEREIDEAFSALLSLRAAALMIGSDAFFNSRAAQLGALVLRHKVPTMYQDREFVAAGGLVSYGGNLDDGYRIVGAYAGRILKGEKPADMPVHQSTKIEMFLNLKTAKALGLTIPPLVLAQADKVIE